MRHPGGGHSTSLDRRGPKAGAVSQGRKQAQPVGAHPRPSAGWRWGRLSNKGTHQPKKKKADWVAVGSQSGRTLVRQLVGREVYRDDGGVGAQGFAELQPLRRRGHAARGQNRVASTPRIPCSLVRAELRLPSLTHSRQGGTTTAAGRECTHATDPPTHTPVPAWQPGSHHGGSGGGSGPQGRNPQTHPHPPASAWRLPGDSRPA